MRPARALDAQHAVELRPEPVVIDDGFQLLDPVRERDLAILVVEELRVGQPRAQHALVAADDQRGVVGLDVRHDQEAFDDRPGRVGQREVFLVLLHRQDQAFLRDVKERRIERAAIDGRPLHESRDFVE